MGGKVGLDRDRRHRCDEAGGMSHVSQHKGARQHDGEEEPCNLQGVLPAMQLVCGAHGFRVDMSHRCDWGRPHSSHELLREISPGAGLQLNG